MPVISDSTFQIRLNSGGRAVYSVQPRHLADRAGSTLTQRIRDHGTQLAHELGGQWFKPGSWEPITDARTLALLERAPEAGPGA